MCNPPDLLDSAVFVVFLAALDVTVEVITVFSHFHSLSLSLLLSPSPSFHLSLSLSLFAQLVFQVGLPSLRSAVQLAQSVMT